MWPLTGVRIMTYHMTDYEISYDQEQKHESAEVVVAPAIGQTIPAEQHFRYRGQQL